MMKNSIILFFIVTAFTQFTLAEKVLVRPVDSSQLEFQQYLTNNQEFSSFVETIHKETASQPAQEKRLFQLGDSYKTNPSYLLANLNELQKMESLSLLSMQYLEDLSIKSLQADSLKSYKAELLQLYCKTRLVNYEEPPVFTCELKLEPLDPIAKKYSWVEMVLIESKAFLPTDSVMLNEQTPYQWKLLSNTYQPIEFYGTYKEVVQTDFSSSEFVQGDCENFISNEKSLKPWTQKSVFFNSRCIKDLPTETSRRSTFKENSTWLYAVAVLALSGSIFYLKDKTLTITY